MPNFTFNAIDGYVSDGYVPNGYIYTLPSDFNHAICLLRNWLPVLSYNQTDQFNWYYIVGGQIIVAKSGLYSLIYQ